MSIMYIFILNRCGAASPRTSITLAPPSVLKGKTIEIVNKWPSKLENHVREFNKFAADVAVWPSVTVEREQTDIERTLEQQQRDLSVTLDAYEQSTEEILGIQGGSLRSLDTNVTKSEYPP
ncbi:hypothetical protein BKA83DRAFT_4487277 [Pisolithus microcarpus]|nr:hypothetical protein BKA83DRAFT_4487277 [Pisolithus microcarpus]